MNVNDRQSEFFLNFSHITVSEPLIVANSSGITQRIHFNKSQLPKLKSEKIMKFEIFIFFFTFQVRHCDRKIFSENIFSFENKIPGYRGTR